MHLKQLKLSGFKSFVEPTVIPVPGPLVGVVGPNGCGKSNIIDAVRWVLGESSAKNLRGESMTDVIFNGSSGRKPVGQASVELIFDNRLGRITGDIGRYQEIAIKRLVTRDGESLYFLNNSRCRRRDIQDVFLGTGAGAQGYAIIGQDMITRLIEARPEALRNHLEEAADVSKYRERRRETLLRIEKTKENLQRLDDIRVELLKQLERLEKQAHDAQTYKALKQKEHRFKAELLAIKWQNWHDERAKVLKDIKQISAQCEVQQLELYELEKQEALLNTELQQTASRQEQLQKTYYQVGKEIVRIEEHLKQQTIQKKRLQEDEQQILEEQDALVKKIEHEHQAFLLVEQQLQQYKQAFQMAKLRQHEAHSTLDEKQQQKKTWEDNRQEQHRHHQQKKHEVEVTKLHLDDLKRRQQQTSSRIDTLKQHSAERQIKSLQKNIQELNTVLDEKRIKAQQWHELWDDHHQRAQTYRKEYDALESTIRQRQDDVQTLTTQQAALNAAQTVALNNAIPHNESLLGDDYKRLLDVLSVDKAWLKAIEWVLGERLHAVVMEDLKPIFPQLNRPEWKGQSILHLKADKKQNAPRPSLAEKINVALPPSFCDVQAIYCAENLEQALSWLPDIRLHESVITSDGIWLSKHWAKVAHFNKEDQEGVLSRKEKLKEINQQLNHALEEKNRLEKAREDTYQHYQTARAQAQESKEAMEGIQSELRELEANLSAAKQQLTREVDAETERQETIQDLVTEHEDLVEQILEQVRLLQELERSLNEDAKQQAALFEEKDRWEERITMLQHALETARDETHQAEMRLEREQLKWQQLKDNRQHDQVRLTVLNQRLTRVKQHVEALDEPDAAHHERLNPLLEEHQQLEQSLNEIKTQITERNETLHRLAVTRKAQANQAQQRKDKLQKQQMQEQALNIKAQAVLDEMAQLNVNLEQVQANMSSDSSISAREQALSMITKQINALGAVNLVAIDEYREQTERKKELDIQYDDLTEALAILDEAIQKMDEETRQRLRDTFDQVNESFQKLFPRLFGGGRAQLELTCDNLLEAGVVVMAQPPGKRNSRIQMLSGGEKAMTAVALVFAFFQLNPAPFCMLDEVDAPLDEANVKRFCRLVKEMSQVTQFLFITHNKVTMELAEHLIGVTMREPGVSRTVSVDVEQALSMPKAIDEIQF